MAYLTPVRRTGQFLLIAIVLAVGAFTGFGAEEAEAQTEASFLCASQWTGELIYRPAGCPPGYRVVDLTSGPVTVCMNRYTGQLVYLPTISCPPGTVEFEIGGNAGTAMCVNRYTAKVTGLRSSSQTCQGILLVPVPTTSTTVVECDNCPAALPDRITLNSTATAAGLAGTVVDVNVVLDITHTWSADLDVTLTSPSGTVVTLFTDICPNSENIQGTLDDDASAPIGTFCPPSGTFRREAGLLTGFNGEDPNGVWILTIVDDETQDSGTLNGWSLEITASTAPPPPPGTVTNIDCDDCPTLLPDEVTLNSPATAAGIAGTIEDVNVVLDITHTFNADLDVTLTSPDGTVVTLFTDICGSSDNIQATLDDSAGALLGDTCPPIGGTFTLQGSGLLADFIGEDPNGVWILTIDDDANVDSGTLIIWSLEITTQ